MGHARYQIVVAGQSGQIPPDTRQYKTFLRIFPERFLGTWVGGHFGAIETNETDFEGVSPRVSFALLLNRLLYFFKLVFHLSQLIFANFD